MRRWPAEALGAFAFGGATLAGQSVMSGPQFSDGLARRSPETVGIDPDGIVRFLDGLEAKGVELHSFMLFRRGAVAAEGWWSPYRPERRHTLHSLTKSFLSAAVGLAVEDGRLDLDDRVVSFFPAEAPRPTSEHLARLTVRDLLTMQSGAGVSISGAEWRGVKTSWVAEFFKTPLEGPPGTRFLYSSANSYVLSAVVQKAVGEKVSDYLGRRLFTPLGIEGSAWETSAEGISPGGNGLACRTSDALKLGILHLQGGAWNGQQLLSRRWVEEATRAHVAPSELGRFPPRYGYGYHWWGGPSGSYCAMGLFGQIVLVMPRHDAVLTTTAATVQNLPPLLSNLLLPAFTSSGAASGAQARLERRLSGLQVVGPAAIAPSHSPLAAQISPQPFKVASNADGVDSVSFRFGRDRCLFEMSDDRGLHRIDVGLGRWSESRTSMTGGMLHHGYEFTNEPAVAAGIWRDDSTFEMTWQYPETTFRDQVTCSFDGLAKVTIARRTNVNSGPLERPPLIGRRA